MPPESRRRGQEGPSPGLYQGHGPEVLQFLGQEGDDNLAVLAFRYPVQIMLHDAFIVHTCTGSGHVRLNFYIIIYKPNRKRTYLLRLLTGD